MNRQEAIRILKKELEITKDIDKRFGDFPEHREALELAISSLETDEAYQLEYEKPICPTYGVDCEYCPTTPKECGAENIPTITIPVEDYLKLVEKSNECEAEDCRSLKDIKEMIERKADELDGQMLDAGGVCIGLYFAIANDLSSVYSKSEKLVLEDIKAEINQAIKVSIMMGCADGRVNTFREVRNMINNHISGKEQAE